MVVIREQHELLLAQKFSTRKVETSLPGFIVTSVPASQATKLPSNGTTDGYTQLTKVVLV